MNRSKKALPSRADREFEASGGAFETGARFIPVALLALTVLALVFTLHFGKEFILPLVLAAVLRLLLAPAQRFLTERARLPASAAAMLLVLTVFGAIATTVFTVSVPASNWIQKAPETLPLLKEKLEMLRRPINYLQEGIKQIESFGDGPPEQMVTVKPPSGLAGNVASGTATTLARIFTTMIVLFFLLSSGDRLLRGFIEVLPNFSDKRQALEIAREIEANITAYLFTVTVMNTGVGIATGLVMWAFGLGDPILWGTVAFLLNYIPVLGPLLGVVMFFVVGVLTFDSPWYAFAPACTYLLIHIAEGETITPMLLASRLNLNPALVIVSLFFWHTLWGATGALLAVPLLAIFKILCDRINRLKPIGHIIGS